MKELRCREQANKCSIDVIRQGFRLRIVTSVNETIGGRKGQEGLRVLLQESSAKAAEIILSIR